MTEDTPNALQESRQRKSVSKPEFAAGDLIGGRYRVLTCLGRGGMGVVYKVEQVFLSEQLALKTLPSNHTSDTSIRRFQLEGKATFGLDHPNLISVKDLGILDDGTPFLVMEFIKGQTLAELLRAKGRLPYKDAAKIFARVCLGLAYAHSKGIVHRDVKPSNLMLTGQTLDAEDCVKVMDFGIAKIMRSDVHEVQTLTKAGEVIGSPLYMSPEQCGLSPVDYRSDIYSVGCVLFECLTGAPPFIGDSSLATLTKHTSETAPRLKEASLGTDFPPALETMVRKMMAKSPDDRYQDLGIVAIELASLIQDDTTASLRAEISDQRRLQSKKDPKPPAISKKTLTALIAAPLIASAATGIAVYNWCKSDKPMDTTAAVSAAPFNSPYDTTFLADQYDGRDAIVSLTAVPFSHIEETNGKHFRVYNLGSKQDHFGSLFEMTMSTTGPDAVCRATAFKSTQSGDYYVSPEAKVGLEISMVGLCEHPQWLNRFHPEDLHALIISSESSVRSFIGRREQTLFDESLVYASHMNSLEMVEFLRTPITIEGLKEMQIERKAHLIQLVLAGTEVDGHELSHMHDLLMQLRIVNLNRMRHAAEVLAALKGSININSLSLQEDGLTDSDMDSIAAMPNLVTLINYDNRITDRGMTKVLGLKHLKILFLSECPITMASVSSLASLQALSYLQLPKRFQANAAQIKKALPNCQVTYDGD